MELQSLPYEQLTETLNRAQIRETLKDVGGKMGRQMFMVPVEQIVVRDNFNWRMQPSYCTSYEEWLYDEQYLDIKGLAAGILASGSVPPLMVDMTAEGTFVITDGFRRYHAIKLLLEQGHTTYADGSEIHMVEVLINSKATTELDRMLAIFTTQENKKLRPVEVGHGFLRIKQSYGYSNEKIAELTGKSRQWVDQQIGLAQEPTVIQKAVEEGKLTATAAITMKNNVESADDRIAMVEMSLETGVPIKVKDVPKKSTVRNGSTSALSSLRNPHTAKPSVPFEFNADDEEEAASTLVVDDACEETEIPVAPPSNLEKQMNAPLTPGDKLMAKRASLNFKIGQSLEKINSIDTKYFSQLPEKDRDELNELIDYIHATLVLAKDFIRETA